MACLNWKTTTSNAGRTDPEQRRHIAGKLAAGYRQGCDAIRAVLKQRPI
jgi:hypothetical protein